MRLCGLAEYICFSQDVNIKVALSSLQFTPGANLTYLAPPPQDNFSWVPNRSLVPQKFKYFLSSKKNLFAQ